MAQFIRKEATIEAVQYRPGLEHPGIVYPVRDGEPVKNRPFVSCRDFVNWLKDGDWIIADPASEGEYQVMLDADFRERYSPVATRANPYDRDDIVRLGNMMLAGTVKIAEYTVRDPETGEHGPRQFHMTHDNTVVAVMGEDSAKVFCNFVDDALAPLPRNKTRALYQFVTKWLAKQEIHVAEDTVEDRVYERAPGLVESLADIVGYAPDSDAEGDADGS